MVSRNFQIATLNRCKLKIKRECVITNTPYQRGLQGSALERSKLMTTHPKLRPEENGK